MKHEEIDRLNLIDRYLMGKLLAEESVSFEEHFVNCPQCIADLQTTKNFMQDLRFVAAEQASHLNLRQPKRASGHFLQMLLGKPLTAAMGCLLIATAVSAFYVINHTRNLRVAVDQAESLSKQWEQRYEDERQSAISAGRKHQEAELLQAEQVRVLEARIKDEEARRAKIEAPSGQRMHSEDNLSVFVLDSVRRGEPSNSETVNQINITRSTAMIVFSIPIEEELQFKNYRITISDERHGLIWEKRGLTPDLKLNSLFISFKRERFRPGNYSLTVEGFKKEGEKVVVGTYPFSIIKTS